MAGQGKRAYLIKNKIQGKQQKGSLHFCASEGHRKQGKLGDRKMAWWVKYLPHEADDLRVLQNPNKGRNQLPASHLPFEYCVTCVHAPHTQSKVIFKNGADGQKADGQRDRKGDRTADSRSTRHKSPMVGPFILACRVESRGGDDVYRDWSLSLSHWCREAFLVSQVIYSGLD